MTNSPQTNGQRRGIAALIPTDTGTATARRRPAQRESTDAGPPEIAVSVPQSQPEQQSVEGLALIQLRPNQVTPNPSQPRTEFDPDALNELAHSLKEIGFLQPIVVRPKEVTSTTATPSYELIAGERRWRASQLAGLEQIPALVRTTDDDAMLRDALLENLQRVALNPLEEAAAYEQLLSDFGGTHEELATRLGRSRPQVSNTLRLLKLPPPVQRRVAAGVLSAGHARALLGLSDSEQMETMAKRVVAEGISVRGLEELVALHEPTKSTRKPRAAAQKSDHAIELEAVAGRLGDALETRVAITMGRSKGKIVVEFAGIDDLHRVISLMNDSVLSPDL